MRPIFIAIDLATNKKCGHEHIKVKKAVQCAFLHPEWTRPAIRKTLEGKLMDLTQKEIIEGAVERTMQEEKKGNRMNEETTCHRCGGE